MEFVSMYMRAKLNQWDYLIVTASNDAQAEAYQSQLEVRQNLGLLSNIRNAIVVADPGGKRVGSGGSTLYSLMEVLNRHSGQYTGKGGPDSWQEILANLRILILHAGGDSKRLPAYAPCGKIFVPVPSWNDTAVPTGLFDRLLPTYLALPEPAGGAGQILITSGDVLLRFEPSEVRFADSGVTGLACYALPEQTSRHGVFCMGQGDQVRLYLQKPSLTEQEEKGAIDAYGQSCLDIGVMNFDAKTAATMLEVFGASAGESGRLALNGPMGQAVIEHGLDFYREICCAMGVEASKPSHKESARKSGSKWSESLLGRLFDAVSDIPFSMNLLRHCDFLDFGTSRALVSSGIRLLQEDRGAARLQAFLDINNDISEDGAVTGKSSWVEGCRVNSSITLGGENVVVGVDVDEPINLPAGACLDVIKGRSTEGRDVWFVRCYGIDDTFKEPVESAGSFCGTDIFEWLDAVGAEPADIWDPEVSESDRSIWNAKLFPAVETHAEYKQWLWMFDPASADSDQAEKWREADRYNLKQILALADHSGFYKRRDDIRATIIRQSLTHVFHPESGFSSAELAHLLRNTDDLCGWVSAILVQVHWYYRNSAEGSLECLVLPRIIHTLGSALAEIYRQDDRPRSEVLPGLEQQLKPAQADWLSSVGLELDQDTSILEWSHRAQSVAFEALESAIVAGGTGGDISAVSVLRSDEIVWARAPARLDFGGGWTDTPPYSLENGGCVVNAAVDLNGQPPIQAYARVIDEPVIRISSIDLGERLEIKTFDELLYYRQATSSFALAKAALALTCLSPESRTDGGKNSLKKALERFGGGIELTTLAAIPKGSGLGTSSIMGAVIIAAIQRVIGTELTQRELFYGVLRLEQALTTGGGWQDQIGGAVDGVKMVVTEPGFVFDARIHHVLPDILDPKINGGLSLLYYTGVTRLAKNILQQVVGRYLNRHRATITTLKQIRAVAEQVSQSLICKDIATFGRLIDVAWQLNKQLDPNSTSDEIESLFERVRPFIYGAKLLGAGGGGFMLMICKSATDASAVRETLEAAPPNERARFFDFDVSKEGLTVTTS
jgi:galactokinase/mevalonate kinase-like predicted kinase